LYSSIWQPCLFKVDVRSVCGVAVVVTAAVRNKCGGGGGGGGGGFVRPSALARSTLCWIEQQVSDLLEFRNLSHATTAQTDSSSSSSSSIAAEAAACRQQRV
jgi:hypothetical protein